VSDTPEPRIRQGRRVICRKKGPHDGARGRVASTWGAVAQVEFETSTLVAKRTYFEPVDYDDE